MSDRMPILRTFFGSIYHLAKQGQGLPGLVFLLRQFFQNSFYLFNVLVTDAFAAAVAAAQIVEDGLPHDASRLQVAIPGTAPRQLAAEAPFARKAVGAEKSPLPRFRITIGPFDLHADLAWPAIAAGNSANLQVTASTTAWLLP